MDRPTDATAMSSNPILKKLSREIDLRSSAAAIAIAAAVVAVVGKDNNRAELCRIV